MKFDEVKNKIAEINAFKEKGHDFVALFINNTHTIVWFEKQALLKKIAQDCYELEIEEKKYIPGVGVKFHKKTYTFFDVFQTRDYEYILLKTPSFQMFYEKIKQHAKNPYEDISFKTLLSDADVSSFIEELNLSRQPRDYQIECFKHSINSRYSTNISATSSGKSLMIYMIAMWMRKQQLKTLIVVPTINLLNQMYNDFVEYGLPNDVFIEKVGGGNVIKQKHFDVVITTWQSLIKKFPYSASIFKCCIVDECHSLRNNGNALAQFLLENGDRIDYRFGFSGTIPSHSLLKQNVISVCGVDVEIISPRKLIDSGNATEAKIQKIILQHNNQESLKFNKKVFYDASERFRFESNFLANSDPRNDFLIRLVNKCRNSGNVLILYKKKDWGLEFIRLFMEKALRMKNFDLIKEQKAIEDAMKTHYCLFDIEKSKDLDDVKSLDELGIFLIDGDISGERREIIRQKVQIQKNAILLGTFACLSTGVNIPNLKHLIFAASNKSEIVVAQSIGRMLRKSNEKYIVNIFDLIDVFYGKKETYSQKHYNEREKIYKAQKFLISEQTVVLD